MNRNEPRNDSWSANMRWTYTIIYYYNFYYGNNKKKILKICDLERNN